MADENKIRDAADAAKGLVEAVPIYQDVAQPAAREIGSALQTVAKCVHIALAPLSALIWGYDKVKDYLDETLSEKLKDVPEERIITPNPAIAGPAVEALRFASQEPSLRDLYATLLATAMDSSTAKNAHPAFVEIIRQMTSDEARIFKVLATEIVVPMISIGGRYNVLNYSNEIDIEFLKHFSLLPDKAGCTHVDLFPSYLNNLCRLGLAEIGENRVIPREGVYEPLEKHQRTQALLSEIKPFGRSVPAIRREALIITELGQQFADACVLQGNAD